jgi:hypothetical protein
LFNGEAGAERDLYARRACARHEWLGNRGMAVAAPKRFDRDSIGGSIGTELRCADCVAPKMSQETIPDRIKHFIRTCIDRLETLDVLLVLSADATRTWSEQELRQEMRSSPLAVEMALRELSSKDLVREQDGKFRFFPSTPELAEMTRRLAACYRDKRTAIITLIYSRAPGPAGSVVR